MAMGPAEYAAIVAITGTVVGGIVRPLCKWLTVRTLAAKARPEDLPKIAEALHPPMQLRPVRPAEGKRALTTDPAKDPDATREPSDVREGNLHGL
ncbi:hypothetical protein [Amycolatopsis circi]|uniref:hypothetical protein n=1 Tax=Amycolatopsis circi TaxID=871959 RepID=UPI000E21EB9F|nr:hypothetical protein [Amycolatopsis circi]